MVRLLDLVEQNHAVRTPAHGLGEIAAFLVADVSRRRSDQARDGVLLHELAHVDAHQRFGGVEQEFRQRLGQLGLAHARGPKEQERAIRPVRIGQAGARAPDRVRHRMHGLVLADHALVQFVFHAQQLVALAFEHLRHRDAGPACDYFGDLLRRHLLLQQLETFGFGFLRHVQLLFQLWNFPILDFGHFREVAMPLRGFDFCARLLRSAP